MTTTIISHKQAPLFLTSRRTVFVFCMLFSLMFFEQAKAQNLVTVRGVVTDKATGETLPSVSIAIVRADNSTVSAGSTNVNGNFNIRVPEKSTILFRFVGYTDYKVLVKSGQTDLKIALAEAARNLEEVVVRGYVTTKREVDAGSSVVISGKTLSDVPASSVEALLQGRVAGLNIQTNTGAPGIRGSVVLRGISNIAVTQGASDEEAFLSPTSPLYVIDGIPVDADGESFNGYDTPGPSVSPLSLIAPEDVANIEVLKDAQATSLYGARGAYGVIVITTKKGNSKIPRIRYKGDFFIDAPPQLRATLGGREERDFKISQILRYGTPADIRALSDNFLLSDSLSTYYNNSTDWQGFFYATRYNQKHNLGIEGGSPEFNYKTNLNYFKQDGIVENTGTSQYTFNMNMTFKPKDSKFSVYALLNGGLVKQNKGSGVGALQRGVATSASASTLLPGPSLYTTSSEVLNNLEVQNDNGSKMLRTSLNIDYSPTRKLKIGSTGSYDLAVGSEDTFTPAAAFGNYAKVYAYNDSRSTLYNRNMLTYGMAIGKDHEFSFSAFNELYIKRFQAYVAEQRQLSSDYIIGPIGYNADFLQSRGGGLLRYTNTRSVSFAGSFNYNYKRKYVLNLNYRADASSFSGNEDPYSKNPSAAFKWNFNKEGLFNDLKWLDNGALRLSWGRAVVPIGNVFTVNGTYTPNGTYNGLPRTGIGYSEIPNPNLGATIRTTYNGGLDVSVLKNRLSVTLESYYAKLDKNQRKIGLPNMTGFNELVSNEIGFIIYGYEADVRATLTRPKSKLNWSMSVNGAISRDVLTKLPTSLSQIVENSVIYRVGSNSLGYYFWNNRGVYSNDKDVPVDPVTGLKLRSSNSATAFYQAGDPNFQDVNGDYIISDKDRVAMGNSQPVVTGGFYSSMSYNSRWTLEINGTFVYDRDIVNSDLARRLRMAGNPFDGNAVFPINDLNYWQNPGDIAKFPNAMNYKRSGMDPFRTYQSLFIEDGSYLKINRITLGYTLSRDFVKRLGLQSARFNATMSNVWTFSRYSGPNAENVTALGYDSSSGYPVPRLYSFGLGIEF